MRFLLARLYAPGFLFGFLALALWISKPLPLPWLLVPVAIAVSFVAEAWLPCCPTPGYGPTTGRAATTWASATAPRCHKG